MMPNPTTTLTEKDRALMEAHDKKNPHQNYTIWGTPKMFQPPLPFSFVSGKPSKEFKKSHQRVKRQMAYHRRKMANLGQDKPKKGPKMSAGAKRLEAYLAQHFKPGTSLPKNHPPKPKGGSR